MKILVITKEGDMKRRSVRAGSSFRESIYQRATFDWVFWFNVFLNGVEIYPDNAPERIETGMDIILAHEDVCLS